MAGVKKIPMRMCIGCREMKPKKDLLRIVRSPDGEISADPTGKKAGRGAYICRSAECVKLASKAHRLESNFSCKVASEVYEAVTAAVQTEESSE